MSSTPFPSLFFGLELGFLAGTQVHTQTGLKAIEALQVGELVLTHPESNPPPRRRRERGEYSYSPVTHIAHHEVQTTVHITLLNLADGISDTLVTTPGQGVWTQPLGWLAANQVTIGTAVVLSFNGNALVQSVRVVEEPVRVYAIEVANGGTYYVGALGTWVGCNQDCVPLTAPVTAAAQPVRSIDFSQPQVLLKIDNYYNDVLNPAPPSVDGAAARAVMPGAAEARTPGAGHRAAAEKLRATFKKSMDLDLNYDLDAIRWLGGYIDRHRLRTPPDQWEGAIQLIGSFLGECQIRLHGGEWTTEGGVGGVMTPGGTAFPHDKVRKQYMNGSEGGDNIVGFIEANAALDDLLKAPTPAQERLLTFARNPLNCVFVPTSTDGKLRWSQVSEVDGPWIKLQAPAGQSYTYSKALTSINSFFVCSVSGKLVHTEWIAQADWDGLPPDVLQQIKQRLPVRTTLGLSELDSGKPFLQVRHGPSDAASKDDRAFSTSVRNVSSERIKLLRFGGLKPHAGAWQLASVTGEFYTDQNFREWYGLQGEWLMPGQTVCDSNNWGQAPVLWAYYGMTESGKYFVAGSVLERPIPRQASGADPSGAHFVAPGPDQPEMAEILANLRTRYERRQQSMNALSLARLKGSRPSWLEPFDGISEIFERQSFLLTEGHIVWAALVQANELLFKPGAADHPALLVYSLDDYFDAHPQELQRVATTFFSFKGVEMSDPELKAVSQHITDELNRAMGTVLPTVFSSREVRASAFMVFRKHIPNGVLSGNLFPVLVHPSTSAALMVPFEFWPIELIARWKEGRL